jgi:glutaredoxin
VYDLSVWGKIVITSEEPNTQMDEGEKLLGDVPDIFIISMSTCTPCTKAKQLLDSYGVDYEYVNVDKATPDEMDLVIDMLDDFMSGRGMSMMYPIIIIHGRKMMQGYSEKALHALAREIIEEDT